MALFIIILQNNTNFRFLEQYPVYYFANRISGGPQPASLAPGVNLLMRPMLAAESIASKSVEPPKIRKEFPETWIWDDLDDNGFVLEIYY